MPLHHPRGASAPAAPGAPPTTTRAPTDTHDGISGIPLNMSTTTHLTGENGDGLNGLAMSQAGALPDAAGSGLQDLAQEDV